MIVDINPNTKKYINLIHVHSKQRPFNLIEAERNIGKTYTVEYDLLKFCINKRKELMYLVRTVDEIQKGVLHDAFSKVLFEKFGKYNWYFSNTEIGIIKKVDDKDVKIRVIVIVALSEAYKIKKRSYPLVDFMYMDELLIEENSTSRYINGYKEPELLLSIYHTVDRETQRVKVYMTTNNISRINPYYIHEFFKIPVIEINQLYYNSYLVYYRAGASDELKELKEKNTFLQQAKKGVYGKYIDGTYIEDSDDLITTKPNDAKLLCNLVYKNEYFGVWYSVNNKMIMLSMKNNKQCDSIAVDSESIKEKTKLFNKKASYEKYISKFVKNNLLRYEDLEVKKKMEKVVYKLFT